MPKQFLAYDFVTDQIIFCAPDYGIRCPLDRLKSVLAATKPQTADVAGKPPDIAQKASGTPQNGSD